MCLLPAHGTTSVRLKGKLFKISGNLTTLLGIAVANQKHKMVQFKFILSVFSHKKIYLEFKSIKRIHAATCLETNA